ncbi:FG-GAP-like repeat-containing protein [Streptomyces sp. NPDC102256]|uniref:FG-GAP-like repeat-containing protein n=1 Tax=Streptomyces sp. NPDC102256 TaxID=3366147 RepID=UPI0037FB3BE6
MRRLIVVGAALPAALAASVLLPPAVAHARTPMPLADFNGDGYGDLAVSAPDAAIDGHNLAGAVVVAYGSSAGIKSSPTAVVSQNTPRVPGVAEAFDRFGASTAAGDFNKDGYSDLAVGSPGEDVPRGDDWGTVTVLWGSPKGLGAGGALSQPLGIEQTGFGTAVTAGDFDGDGYADIAASTGSGTHLWLYLNRSTGQSGEMGFAHADFEASAMPATGTGITALAAGDVDGDGRDDLAAVTNPLSGSGGVLYLSPGVPAKRRAAGELPPALSLAIGDVDGDGHGDVVSGQPYGSEEVHGARDGGSVTVLGGSAQGVDGQRAVVITQNTAGVPGVVEEGDRFGWSVELGDVNRDGRADLVTGAIDEGVGLTGFTGSVTVLPGSAKGLTGTGSYAFHQDTPGVPGVAESRDSFGEALALADTDRDGRLDLAVGAPGENGWYGALTSLRGDGVRITFTRGVGFSAETIGLATGEDWYPEFGAPISG